MFRETFSDFEKITFRCRQFLFITFPAQPSPFCLISAYIPAAILFFYDIFVHGSKFQFIDGINLNLTHVCVCCEIIFVFTYIALVVFVYKVKQNKIIQ